MGERDQLHQCYILVPEVSPDYLKSRWAVGKADEPAESVSGPLWFLLGSLREHEKTESIQADDAHAARCVCPRGWAQLVQPTEGFRAGAKAAIWRCRLTWTRESQPPSSHRESSCPTLPSCFHPVFTDNWGSTAVWLYWYPAQSLVSWRSLYCFPYFPLISPLHA